MHVHVSTQPSYAWPTPGHRDRGSVLRRRHGLRVPEADALVEVSSVGQQRRTGSAEAEHPVFDRRLALAHGIEEGAMVLAVRVMVFGRHVFVFLLRAHSVGGGVGLWILPAIVGEELLLHGL